MGEKQIDPRKLCIMNLDVSESDDTIRSMCEKYGPLKHFCRPPTKKELAFVLFANEK